MKSLATKQCSGWAKCGLLNGYIRPQQMARAHIVVVAAAACVAAVFFQLRGSDAGCLVLGSGDMGIDGFYALQARKPANTNPASAFASLPSPMLVRASSVARLSHGAPDLLGTMRLPPLTASSTGRVGALPPRIAWVGGAAPGESPARVGESGGSDGSAGSSGGYRSGGGSAPWFLQPAVDGALPQPRTFVALIAPRSEQLQPQSVAFAAEPRSNDDGHGGGSRSGSSSGDPAVTAARFPPRAGWWRAPSGPSLGYGTANVRPHSWAESGLRVEYCSAPAPEEPEPPASSRGGSGGVGGGGGGGNGGAFVRGVPVGGRGGGGGRGGSGGEPGGLAVLLAHPATLALLVLNLGVACLLWAKGVPAEAVRGVFTGGSVCTRTQPPTNLPVLSSSIRFASPSLPT